MEVTMNEFETTSGPIHLEVVNTLRPVDGGTRLATV
jgi:hypothetical protein